MERQEAITRIKQIVGVDLRELADKYRVTVFKGEKKNKGWAGHVIERYLGLPLNSAQAPNFGSWELKTISLKYLKNHELTVKETMAITMIDPYNVERTEFENSHLLAKLKKIVIPARIWISPKEESSILFAVTDFDMDDPMIYAQVKADYDLVRQTIISKGFSALTGEMGIFIQPRTKGPGHGSVSRAFYARTSFLKRQIFVKYEKRI
ncbi:MAG: MvaI/BcnI family restriction endonuclease [Dehalococcoidia bacterium]